MTNRRSLACCGSSLRQAGKTLSLWARRTGCGLSLLTAVGCAELSPQIVEPAPYKFAASTASASQIAASAATPAAAAARPRFFGHLAEALDQADIERRSYVSAVAKETGANRLLEMALIPAGAYALYRGIFGGAEGARREIVRLGLSGAAAVTLGQRQTSPSRQQMWLDAADAMNCAIRASATRYLYLQEEIAIPSPATAQGHDAQSLQEVRQQLGTRSADLRAALRELSIEMRSTPATVSTKAAMSPACSDVNYANTPLCQAERQRKANSAVNPARRLLESEYARAEDSLTQGADAAFAGQELYGRLERADVELNGAVTKIRIAADRATLGTEPGLSTLPQAIGGLRALAQALVPQIPLVLEAQSSRSGAQGAAPNDSLGKLSPKAEQAWRYVIDSRLALDASVRAMAAFTKGDAARAQAVQKLGECEFVRAGARLEISPFEIAAEVTIGQARTWVVEGGTEMPSANLGNLTSAKADSALVLNRTPAAGKQTLTVTFMPPADTKGQRPTLTLRNGDLSHTVSMFVTEPPKTTTDTSKAVPNTTATGK